MRDHNTYTQRFSPGSQNRDYQLDFSLFSFQCYNTYLYMLKHPIPWTENHHIQNHGPKTIPFKTMCENHAQNHTWASREKNNTTQQFDVVQQKATRAPKTITSKTMDRKPSRSKTCVKIMHKTIRGLVVKRITQPNNLR